MRGQHSRARPALAPNWPARARGPRGSSSHRCAAAPLRSLAAAHTLAAGARTGLASAPPSINNANELTRKLPLLLGPLLSALALALSRYRRLGSARGPIVILCAPCKAGARTVSSHPRAPLNGPQCINRRPGEARRSLCARLISGTATRRSLPLGPPRLMATRAPIHMSDANLKAGC